MQHAEHQATVMIPAGRVVLEGDLTIPAGARGLVLFAHGSGSSRKSSRNRLVARVLQNHGIGTLLLDLLTAAEDQRDAIDARLRFDIPLLSARLGAVTEWMRRSEPAKTLGYFGASTGAAAALIAAAQRPSDIAAVVSRGGRPDLAGDALAHVRAPTLLIVGGADPTVLALNQDALEQLAGPKRLIVVPHATHLFEEAGALEQVARAACEWFAEHLGAGAEPTLAPLEGRP